MSQLENMSFQQVGATIAILNIFFSESKQNLFQVLSIKKFAISFQRSLPENEESNSPTEVCQRNTPCGWAVYTRYTRVIDYFMKNKYV